MWYPAVKLLRMPRSLNEWPDKLKTLCSLKSPSTADPAFQAREYWQTEFNAKEVAAKGFTTLTWILARYFGVLFLKEM